MTNFWRALSQAGPAAIDSFHSAEMQRAQRREQAIKEASARMYGGAVQRMFAPPMPQQAPQGMPGLPGGPTGTGMPVPSGPPPMPGGGPPSPPGMPPMPQGPGAGMSQQASPKLNWQDILTTISRENPGADPAAIAGAVDKLQPLMHEQAQAEWRQLQFGLQKDKFEMQSQNTEADNTRADASLDLNKNKFEYRMKERDRRLDQMQQALDSKVVAAKLDPTKKAKLDALKSNFVQAQTTYRSAEVSASYARYKGVAARKAEAALRKAEEAHSKYLDYVEQLGISVDDEGDTPEPVNNAPPPGILPPATSKIPLGQPNASPGDLGPVPPPPGTGPKPQAGKPSTVQSAKPTGTSQPTTLALPKHITMARKNAVYDSPKGPVMYTGQGDKPFKLVKWDGKTWVPK